MTSTPIAAPDAPAAARPHRGEGPDRIRVVVQQPALAKYRVPVFRELARRPGIDLLLVYGEDGVVPNVEPDGFRAEFVPIRTWRGPGPELFWHAAQTRYARRDAADVLVLAWNTRFLSLLPALRRSRRQGVGTVLWGHGESKSDRAWADRLRRWVARRASATLFYTRSVADRFIATGGDPSRTFVAPNSIDQVPVGAAREVVEADPSILGRVRAQHGLTPGRTILFVSRFDPRNDLHLLFEAAAAIAPEFSGLRVLVVGKGQDEARLRGVSDRLGLGGVVSFLGPIYEESLLAPLFMASDVFAYPSNMGLSLLHAFGYGLPVVTGNNRRLHGPEIEALRDGQNGLMFPHGDGAALASTLRRVLSDDGLRARLGAEAARTAATEYTVPRMVDGMEAAIRHAAAVARARSGRFNGRSSHSDTRA